MKKFFSLLCATLLVFSASAAPVAKKAEIAKKAVAVEQVQKVQFEKAQSEKIVSLENIQLSNQLNAAPALKVNNQTANLWKKGTTQAQTKAIHHNSPRMEFAMAQAHRTQSMQKMTGVVPSRAPQATKEELTITAYEIDDTYADGEYDLYFLTSIGGETRQISIYLYNSSLEGSYDINNYNIDPYSCVIGPGYDPYYEMSACSMTITSLGDNQYSCECSFTIETGSYTFSTTLEYEPTPPTPVTGADTISVSNVTVDLTSSWYYTHFYFMAGTKDQGNVNADIMIMIDDYSASITGDWKYDDIYYYSSVGSKTIDYYATDSYFKCENVQDNTYKINALLHMEGDVIYVIDNATFTIEAPAPIEKTREETINCTTGKLKDLIADYDAFTIEAYNADSSRAVFFEVDDVKSIIGTFTEEDMNPYYTYVADADKEDFYNMIEASLSISINQDGDTVIAATMLAQGEINTSDIPEFTISLTLPYQEKPAPTPTLAEKYDANGLKYNGTTRTWLPVDSWTLRTGTDEEGDYLDGIIPALTSTTDKVYYTIEDDSVLVFKSTLLKLVNTGSAIMAASIESFSSGDGSFRLVVGKDGSLKLQNPNEVIGYGAYSYPELVYQGSFGQYAGLTYTVQAPITERDTVKVTADMKLLAEPTNGIIKVSAESNDTTFILEVVGTDTIGTFSLADGTLSQQNYYGIVSDAGKSDFAEGEVTIDREGTGLKLTGLMIGNDEKAYVFDWTYTPITERDTVKVNLNSIIIEEDINSQTETHRGWLFEGQDTDTMYIVQVLGQEKFGTFSYATGTLGKNFYNIIPSSGQGRCQFLQGEVTITEDKDGITLIGELLGQDEKVYVFHWNQPSGVLNYDADAPFDATFAYSDMSADLDEGVIGIYATNAEGYTIGLELYADPAATEIPAGVYTISDTQEAGTALQSLGIADGYLTECFAGTRGASGINVPCWFMVDGTITLSYDEYGKLKVVVDAKNSYGQPVTALIAYEKIEPKSTVEIANAEVYVYDGFVELYGIMNFYGGNADGYKFDLYAYADTIAGDFLEAIDFGDCELTTPDGKVGVIDAYEFKVERDGKNLTLTAKVLGSDTVQYNISATGYLGYIQGDAVEGYVGEFAVEEVAIQQVTLSRVKYIYIQGENAAGDQLALVVKGELKDGAIAAGTYNEVMACTGFDAEGQINPSFVGNADAVWFIQSGELVVNENGAMAFAGVNSYDAPVAIGFTVPTVPTTFNVTVPEGTDACYLVGSLNAWNIGEPIAMTKVDDTHYTYTAEEDLTGAEYKYVHGAEWAKVEKNADGSEMGNRVVNAAVMNDTVAMWADATGLRNPKANVKAAKRINNGQIIIVRENKEYNILGAAL